MKVYVCYLLFRLSLVHSPVCGYRFGDTEGTGFYQMLGNKGIKYSIHGEFSNSREDYPTVRDDKCDFIELSLINPHPIWYSFENPDNYDFSGNFIRYECKKHRFDDEYSGAFIRRVL
ncbi:hypothetical protein RF11_06128 [Thelohanellus kitauei]|uniref:Uncharacterized protein n=1 Tax=Thelohanellus kitauei TaxID=669202 RepID=A0A0C2MT80_THEKT|nr:hypothetical protein RF11_06128 [Thelohanellus kitauei]